MWNREMWVREQVIFTFTQEGYKITKGLASISDPLASVTVVMKNMKNYLPFTNVLYSMLYVVFLIVVCR